MLRIVDTIVTLIADVAPLAEKIGRHDPSLAKQLREALSSVALNVAEGSDQRGARRTNHSCIASGPPANRSLRCVSQAPGATFAPCPRRRSTRSTR